MIHTYPPPPRIRRGRPLRLAAAALAAALGLVLALPAAAFAWTDTTQPMVSSAVVDGTKLTVEFGELMQGTFDPDDWTWALDGVDQGHPHLVMWVGGLGRATLTVSPEVVGGQQVTLSYTPGDGSLLRDGAGNQLAAFTAHPVRNDSPQPVIVVTLDLDDVTEETRQLADGDGQEPPTFSDPPDGRSDAQGQQSRFAEPETETQPDSEPLLDNHDRSNQVDGYGDKRQDHAQSFTTGKHRFGYALTQVSFDICFGRVNRPENWDGWCTPRPADAPADPTYKISLWTARRVPATGLPSDSGSLPGYYVPDTQVATFDKANNDPLAKTPLVDGYPDTDHNSFTAPGGPVLLDPDTTYVVVFDFTSNSPDSANPYLTRETTHSDTDYGFFMDSGSFRTTVRDTDPDQQLAPWNRWHMHLRRSSSTQGPGGWQIGTFGQGGTYGETYRIQLDGYEIWPPTLSQLGKDWSQVGSQHPGGCGGTPMPSMSPDDLGKGLYHYCHTPSGTWGLGRWPGPCDADHPYYAELIARPGSQCGEPG